MCPPTSDGGEGADGQGEEGRKQERAKGASEGGRKGSKCVARAPPIASAVVRSLVRSLSPSSRCHCCQARRRRPPDTAVTLVFLWRREIPEGRVRFVLLSPPRCQTKSYFICRGWHDNYTCTTTSTPRPSVYLIVRSGAICTSPLHCRSGNWAGAGPDRAIHFPASPSMDGMSVGRTSGRVR